VLSVAPAPPIAPDVVAVIPDRPANDNLPEIRGTAAAGTTVSIYAGTGCTGAPVAAGTASAFAATGLTVAVADNSVTSFAARTTDPATGLSSGCSASSRLYVEDSAAPETTIVAGPSGATDDDAPVFRFATSDPGATLSCRLNGAQFAACISPLQLPVMAAGEYRFEVRATDAAGNADPTPATRTFGVGTFVQGSSLPGCRLHSNLIVGTANNDELLGTAATDLLVGMSSSDVLRGLGGRDCLYGQSGTDRLFGGAAGDLLNGGRDNDALAGDSGDDRLSDRRGRDSFSGGAGSDRIDARDTYARDRRTRDDVACGPGHDTVLADRRDRVARDCERVTRREAG
jgi:Ca2+-binding RTX toxin-like protein